MVNIGGGFPASIARRVAVANYAAAVTAALTRHFGNHLPEVIVEPGRSLVGMPGDQSEVVLISDKGDGDVLGAKVYLDVGKFSGLAETMKASSTDETPGRDGHHASGDRRADLRQRRHPHEDTIQDAVVARGRRRGQILSTGAPPRATLGQVCGFADPGHHLRIDDAPPAGPLAGRVRPRAA